MKTMSAILAMLTASYPQPIGGAVRVNLTIEDQRGGNETDECFSAKTTKYFLQTLAGYRNHVTFSKTKPNGDYT